MNSIDQIWREYAAALHGFIQSRVDNADIGLGANVAPIGERLPETQSGRVVAGTVSLDRIVEGGGPGVGLDGGRERQKDHDECADGADPMPFPHVDPAPAASVILPILGMGHDGEAALSLRGETGAGFAGSGQGRKSTGL